MSFHKSKRLEILQCTKMCSLIFYVKLVSSSSFKFIKSSKRISYNEHRLQIGS